MSVAQSVKSIEKARHSAITALKAMDGEGDPADVQRELALAVLDLATAMEASISPWDRYRHSMHC